MKTSSHFSSKHSALVLGTVFTLSLVGAGVTLAQSLLIPTNLANAAITIQKIFLSPTGVAGEGNPAVTIALDGANGSITATGSITASGINARGNITLWWDLQFTKPAYQCPSWSTGCILKVNSSGLVIMTNELSGANNNVFKRTASNSKNIYLALDDGSEAGVGSTQSYLRVGATSNTGDAPDKPDTAMVVAGKSEMRGGILIRKANNDSVASNTGTNTQVLLNNNFTEIDLNTTAGKVNFASQNLNSSGNPQDTSFVFTANGSGASTSMGINTTTPDKTLDVEGDASITDALIIGFPSTASAGTDKLKINGNTRADAYYYNSDRRYKSDIEVLSSPLANLLKISGYSYFNKLSQKQDIGIIAQEIETVYPQLVQTDAEWYKSVQYGNLVAPIIEAIKELSTKIDSLFTLYVSQQAKIDTLEARLLKLNRDSYGHKSFARTGEAMTNVSIYSVRNNCMFSLSRCKRL